MKRYYLDLIMEALGAALLAICIWLGSVTFPFGWLRLLLGISYIFFLPGYALQNLLFPPRKVLDRIERVALSFGLSLGLIAPSVLFLEYVLGGIHLWKVYVVQVSLVLGFSLLSVLRRSRVTEEDWHPPKIRLWRWLTVLKQPGEAKRVWIGLSFVAILFLAGVAIMSLYPDPTKYYTEFYILGKDQQVQFYPDEIVAGDTVTITFGISNHERHPAIYRIHVLIGDQTIDVGDAISLAVGDAWQAPLTFTIQEAGDNQHLRFLLEREGSPVPYRELWLWVNVSQPVLP